MSKRIYQKPPKTFKEQLTQLKNRNLIVEDENKALRYLSFINYYRLSAYFLPYQKVKDQFNEGTTFRQIIDTYLFDKALRLLVFDCIERIEVAIRTQFVYCMATRHNNSHWQDDHELFILPYEDKQSKRKKDPYNDFQKIILKAKKNKRPELFIKHYTDSYTKPSNPPSWMCFELLTIGELSRIYEGLRNNSDKKRIAEKFDLHYNVFTSWLHSLTYVRNICAHHSRLWNKDLAVEPAKLQKPIGNWIDKRYSDNNKRVFYFLCLLEYFLLRINPNSNLKEKLLNIIDKYPTIPIKYIGIPSDKNGNLLDWQNEPLWKKNPAKFY